MRIPLIPTTGVLLVNATPFAIYSLGNVTANTSFLAPVHDNGNTSRLDWSRDVRFYAMGVVISVGLFCNVFAILVFMTSQTLRRTATGHFLTALAVADFIFLSGELFRWLHSWHSRGTYLGTDLMYTYQAACKMAYFLRYLGKLASAWLTVVITAERYIAVASPLRAHVSLPLRPKVALPVVFLCSAAMMSFPFWTVGIRTHKGKRGCFYLDREVYNIFNWVFVRVGSLLLPWVIIMCLTCRLTHSLLKARRERLGGLREDRPSGNRQGRGYLERQLTYMLIAVAVSFLILRLPYAITFYLQNYKEELLNKPSQHVKDVIYTANKMCDVIAASNYAINPILYYMCAKTFRQEAWALITCSAFKRQIARRMRSGSMTMTSLLPGSLRRLSLGSGANGHVISGCEHRPLSYYAQRRRSCL